MHKKELLNIDMQYSLNEICLLPSATPTDITSRKQVNPFDENGNLPIFVAPMTSVLNKSNYKIFADKGVIPILPRNCTETRDIAEVWHSYSLQEFESIIDSSKDYNGYHILIDVANGHMRKIYDLVKKAKEKWPNIVIMIGNIANPAIYYNCCDAGVDYVRVGIGGGSVCSTSVQCGIHASHQYMIENIKKLSCYYNNPNRTKIIADGGINTLDKAIKALAIGYDYVMMGKCFAECKEACGEIKEIGCKTEYPNIAIDTIINYPYLPLPEPKEIPGTGRLVRKYYGMASEQGQIDISGGCTKNPEGVETWIPIITTLDAFVIRFEAALRSTMSYTGATTLEKFHDSKYDIQSIEEFKSYYK